MMLATHLEVRREGRGSGQGGQLAGGDRLIWHHKAPITSQSFTQNPLKRNIKKLLATLAWRRDVWGTCVVATDQLWTDDSFNLPPPEYTPLTACSCTWHVSSYNLPLYMTLLTQKFVWHLVAWWSVEWWVVAVMVCQLALTVQPLIISWRVNHTPGTSPSTHAKSAAESAHQTNSIEVCRLQGIAYYLSHAGYVLRFFKYICVIFLEHGLSRRRQLKSD